MRKWPAVNAGECEDLECRRLGFAFGCGLMACRAGARGNPAPPSPRGLRRGSLARVASEGWWGRKDSNLRSHTAADLQSAPFATRDTSPSNSVRRPPARVAADRTMDGADA